MSNNDAKINPSTFYKNIININIFSSFFILIISFIIAKFVSYKLTKIDMNNNRKIVILTLSNIVFYVIILIGLLIALLNLGFQIGSIIVFLSSIGIAIALGIQNILKQFVSGLIITFNNMYNLSDHIITNGTEGIVTNFTLLTTTITDPENITITIPNDKIINSNITNITYNSSVKVKLDFTINNQDNFDFIKFMELIKRTILLSKYVMNDKIDVNVDTISHIFGTKIVVKAFINSKQYRKARDEIRVLLLRALSNTQLLNGKINIGIIEKGIK
jgi:small-conductance mechanosensitive channel